MKPDVIPSKLAIPTSLLIQIRLSSDPEGTKCVRGDVWRQMYAFYGSISRSPLSF